jgi:hypothetical protein
VHGLSPTLANQDRHHRDLGPVADSGGRQDGWPLLDSAAEATELDVLLEKAGKQGFMWHMFRADQYGPDVLAGVFQRSGCADVLVLSGTEHAHAYRLPTTGDTDVFSPTRVYWWYAATPVWTLRALLTLAAPDDPDPPEALVQAPPGLGISGDRVPVRMRRRPAADSPVEST